MSDSESTRSRSPTSQLKFERRWDRRIAWLRVHGITETAEETLASIDRLGREWAITRAARAAVVAAAAAATTAAAAAPAPDAPAPAAAAAAAAPAADAPALATTAAAAAPAADAPAPAASAAAAAPAAGDSAPANPRPKIFRPTSKARAPSPAGSKS